MKNKKLTYILIPVVLLIWGAVILQLVGDDIPTAIPVGESFEEQGAAFEFKDTNQLALNYSDPFLNRRLISIKAGRVSTSSHTSNVYGGTSVTKPVKKGTKPVVKHIIKWPLINYAGSVNSGVLVEVNHRQYIVKEGQEIEGILFQKIYSDSLSVEFKKETRTIEKNKF